MAKNLYRNGLDCVELGEYYINHIVAMTDEKLLNKNEIAEELASRDMEIDQLKEELKLLKEEHAKYLRLTTKVALDNLERSE